ncbi:MULTISPECIES: hypothetical protein [unclassified Arenibacter]|uniref:hypothetical protein n=1 Tax=unclassified Arenibacter TaxID=2615047 RepID=UPI0011C1863B|nr:MULTISPECIES: hypothetical protein [unclassified Arenibacter]
MSDEINWSTVGSDSRQRLWFKVQNTQLSGQGESRPQVAVNSKQTVGSNQYGVLRLDSFQWAVAVASESSMFKAIKS